MTETFQYASCSGPLDFEGTPMQKCRFCGSTVIGPPELFHHQALDVSVLNERHQKIARRYSMSGGARFGRLGRRLYTV